MDCNVYDDRSATQLSQFLQFLSPHCNSHARIFIVIIIERHQFSRETKRSKPAFESINMLSLLAIITTTAVLLLVLVQTVLVIGYCGFLQRGKVFDTPSSITGYSTEGDDEETVAPELADPKVAIVLCLRGADDSLVDCLAELDGQDYPDYQLHIAFDSEDDPAVEVVQGFFENRESQPHLTFFQPTPNCSYKCAAIVSVVNELPDDIEVVAFCDADAVVDQYWLRDLVEPLSQPETGATTGNRWFSPFNPTLGAIVRKQWNSAAIVQMQAYDIAWGGSLAIKRHVIDQCDLLNRWSAAFCEDTLLTQALKRKRLRVHRVPDLIVDNREETTISEAFEWITRQLLTVRLHHPDWLLVLLHGVLTAAATIGAPILAIVLLLCGELIAARSVALAYIVYQVANAGLLFAIGVGNRAVLKRRSVLRDRDSVPLEIKDQLKSLLLLQLLHPIAVLKAAFTKQVSWRDVNYKVAKGSVRVSGLTDATRQNRRQL